MRIISLYLGERRYVLESTGELLSRANQAIATLERYKSRLDEVSNALSALEIEDLVTVRDAAIVSQRLEMVRRIADEVTGQVVELGTDGRLLALQLEELMAGVDADRELIARDYVPTGRRSRTAEQVAAPSSPSCPRPTCSTSPRSPARMGCPARRRGWTRRSARAATGCWPGCRALPGAILDRVVEHFGGLQKLLAASVEDLQVVDGVGETRARAVREAISRLAEVVDHRPLLVASSPESADRELRGRARRARTARRRACRCRRRRAAGCRRTVGCEDKPDQMMLTRTGVPGISVCGVGAGLDLAVVAAPHPRLAVVDAQLDLGVGEVLHARVAGPVFVTCIDSTGWSPTW